MKKFVFINLLVFCGILSVNCQQVTRNEAVNAAINTMKYCGKQNISESDFSVFIKQKGDTVLLYEVVFQTGEMVLLSGNRSCLPVLGYRFPEESVDAESILSRFDDIPDGLRDMIEEYAEQVENCFVYGATEGYQKEWQDLQTYNPEKSNRSVLVSPLLMSSWGQSWANEGFDPNAYNYYVEEPSVCSYNQNCPAGCVAVAMAQILNYWKYPVYVFNNTEQYDWCNMSNVLNTQSPNYAEEKKAVARLIRDCGIAVNMSYCSDGDCSSGADSFDVPDALMQFGYNNATIKRRFWHQNNWGNMLKADLDKGYPVYYKGRDKETNSGHAFVCDGYDSGNLFHFNWGWNGSDDMWCTVSQLNPGSYSFTSNQAAIFDVFPSENQDYCDFTLLLYKHYILNYYLPGNNMSPLYPYENVPKTASRLISVENHGQYPNIWSEIPSGANCEYVAHEEIIIQNGFIAQEGCSFHAYITPCESCESNTRNNEKQSVSGGSQRQEVHDLSRFLVKTEESTHGDVTDSETTPLAVSLHPNPVIDNVTLTSYMEEDGFVAISLYNMFGVVYPLFEGHRGSGAYSDVFSLEKIPSGVYVILIKTNGRQHASKIIKL